MNIPLPSHIKRMLPTDSKPGQIVHDERSRVIEDRREAVKAMCVVLEHESTGWGETSPRERWRMASRLMDLDWRISVGRFDPTDGRLS